jgi:hypothetical protein
VAKRVARREKPLDAKVHTLGIPMPRSRPIVAPVTVMHLLDERWAGIADPQDLHDEPIKHLFGLVVEFERFASYDANDPGPRDEWDRIGQAHALSDAADQFNADRLAVARLEIGELPSHMVAQLGWFSSRTVLGDSMRVAIPLIEWLSDNEDNDLPGMPLAHGLSYGPASSACTPIFVAAGWG